VKPFSKSTYGAVKTSDLLQVVHSDVVGPMQTVSQGGAKYFVTFIDDYSRFVVAFFIAQKSQVVDKFIEFKALMENQLNKKIKCLRTDNGTEYVNKKMAQLCKGSGIVHQTTVPYSPQQNGLAERMNRTLVERARAMMEHMEVPKCWWAEAVNTAVFLTNRLPCAAVPESTPFEVCFQSRPDLSMVRVFGSKGVAHIDKSQRVKFDGKGFRCILLGYSETTKGYRVWNLDKKRVQCVRSAVFDETPKDQFVNVETDANSGPNLSEVDDEVFVDPSVNSTPLDEPIDMDTDEDMHAPSSVSRGSNRDVGDDPAFEIDDAYMESELEELDDFPIEPRSRIDRDGGEVFQSSISVLPQSTEPTSRALVPVVSTEAIVPRGRFDSGSSEGSIAPQPKRLRLANESANAASEVPESYKTALNAPDGMKWKMAINEELKALQSKETWTLVDHDPSHKVIGSKWVFALKRNEHGVVTRYKARLVALGYRQTYGVDYWETYSPVASMNSIRTLLAVCCHKGYYILKKRGLFD
jgi:hypothetical protein